MIVYGIKNRAFINPTPYKRAALVGIGAGTGEILIAHLFV
jgi:hypothetical protein